MTESGTDTKEVPPNADGDRRRAGEVGDEAGIGRSGNDRIGEEARKGGKAPEGSLNRDQRQVGGEIGFSGEGEW